nr:hydrophobic protein [Kitasatospora phosalacinea]
MPCDRQRGGRHRGASGSRRAGGWVAVIVLVVWLVGFVARSTNATGGRGRWYRW